MELETPPLHGKIHLKFPFSLCAPFPKGWGGDHQNLLQYYVIYGQPLMFYESGNTYYQRSLL